MCLDKLLGVNVTEIFTKFNEICNCILTNDPFFPFQVKFQNGEHGIVDGSMFNIPRELPYNSK